MKTFLATIAALSFFASQAQCATYTLQDNSFFDSLNGSFTAEDADHNGMITTNEVTGFDFSALWGDGTQSWRALSGENWDGSFFSVIYNWRQNIIDYMAFGQNTTISCSGANGSVETRDVSNGVASSADGLMVLSFGYTANPTGECSTLQASNFMSVMPDQTLSVVAPVPGPATLPLILSGLAFLGFAAHRRQSRKVMIEMAMA